MLACIVAALLSGGAGASNATNTTSQQHGCACPFGSLDDFSSRASKDGPRRICKALSMQAAKALLLPSCPSGQRFRDYDWSGAPGQQLGAGGAVQHLPSEGRRV